MRRKIRHVYLLEMLSFLILIAINLLILPTAENTDLPIFQSSSLFHEALGLMICCFYFPGDARQVSLK
jgi:hypothetical protein